MLKPETLTIHRFIQKSVLYLACAASLYALARFVVDLPDGLPRHGLMAGLGRPGGWRFFFSVLAPVAWLLLSLLGEGFLAGWRWLKPDSPLRAASLPQFVRYDAYSLIGLPLMALGMLGHGILGDYHTLLGVLYLAVVGCKTGILVWLLNRVVQDFAQDSGRKETSPFWPGLGQGIIVFMLYACLALWTVQVIPCTASETNYLFKIHQHLFDLGLAGSNADDPTVWGGFYWGAWSWTLVEPPLQSPALAVFLAPGYWLAGRTGALISMAFLAGGVMLLFHLCGRYLGYSAKRVLLAGWLLALSPVFWVYSQHIQPELLGGLGMGLAAIYLLTLKERGWAGLAMVLVLAAFIVWAGTAPLALGVVLILAGIFGLLWQGGGVRNLGFAFVAALAGVLAFFIHLPGTQASLLDPSQFLQLIEWPAALAAVVFDQQQGILSQAPWLILALTGWWFLLRRNSWAAVSSALLLGAWGLGAAFSQWLRLETGAVLPLSGFAVVAPLMALWALPLLAKRSHGAWKVLVSALLVLNLGLVLLLNLVPVWRFMNNTGASPVLMGLGNLSEAALYRFFPGFLNYYGPDMLKALPWAVLIILLGLWALAWRSRQDTRADHIKVYWGWGLGLVLAGFFVLVLAGRLLPTASIQAELMNSPGSKRLTLEYPGPIYLALPKGGKAGAWVRGNPDNKRIVLWARVHDSGQHPAIMGVYVDGRLVRQVKLEPGVRRHPAAMKLTQGRRWLELGLIQAPPSGTVLIDRLDFE